MAKKNSLTIKHQLIKDYQTVRSMTEKICMPLEIEDYIVQSMTDVSPPKWHLAHTTWFFETFVLLPCLANYQVYQREFHHLFNSYYQGIGNPFPRSRRGLLSRPTVKTVYAYREFVNNHMLMLIENASAELLKKLKPLIILGLHHEQQHQELLLMDIKYNFSIDPNFPPYQSNKVNNPAVQSIPLQFISIAGGLIEIGHQDQEFCFDNELPRHQKFLKPYQLANRLVTNREYAEFIDAGGYDMPHVWLSDGWDWIKKYGWESPAYWQKQENKWYQFTLSGLQELALNEPVVHISYYEADAYARWRDRRLPSEEEWEYFTVNNNVTIGNFMESETYQPKPATSIKPQQFFGDCWEWTQSSYSPYPGYKPFAGALGEYNGKFMNNQMVLRGGSCVTPASHIRATYRNFFQPNKRWQFSGIRLAADLAI